MGRRQLGVKWANLYWLVLLRTLGDLDLEGTALQRSKLLVLIAYLVLEGAKPRSHLAALFWPLASNPAASVRMALWQLRRTAPGSVGTDGASVRASVDADVVHLLQRLDVDDGAAAVDLYVGPFLAGFELPALGAELEEWVFATREYVAGRVRQRHLHLAERAARDGDLADAARRAEVAWRLPGAGPADPDVLGRLYRLSVAAGTSLAAPLAAEAATYGVRLQLTRDEACRALGVHAGSDGPRPDPAPLPRRTTSFVGRETERAELTRWLNGAQGRLATLVGAGGVGKTRLALETATSAATDGPFAGAVAWAELDVLRDPALVLPAIARALGVPLPGRDPPVAELAAGLGVHPRLVVLDNFEHLVAAAGEIAALIRAAPALTLLVTSRERLGIEDEQLFRLHGLQLRATGTDPSDEDDGHAVALFVQRARRVRRDFELDDAALPHVERVCRLVDGSPLAIELAAAWIRFLDVQAIADEIAGGLDFLSSDAPDVAARHASLRATFDHSWRLLPEREQAVLRRLAVFEGGFTRQAASRVAGASIAQLAALADKSLVRVLDGGRYDRHALVRGFTEELLAARPDERDQVRSAHAAFVLDLVETAEEELKGPDQAAWFDRLEAEHGNVRAALTWAHDGDHSDVGLRLAGALWRFWSVRGHVREGRAWTTRLLARAPATADALVRAKAASAAGVLAFGQGDVDDAARWHGEALALRREAGHTWGVAASLHNLGGVHASQGDLGAAQRLFEESLAILRSLDQPWSVASSLVNLGRLASLQGDLELARRRLDESLALRRSIGDTLGTAESLRRLADLDRSAGDLDRAYRRWGEALACEHEAGDVEGLIRSFETFADLATKDRALECGVWLLAAAAALRASSDVVATSTEREAFERRRADLTDALGTAGFAAAWAAGSALTRDEAVVLALEVEAAGRPHGQGARAGSN